MIKIIRTVLVIFGFMIFGIGAFIISFIVFPFLKNRNQCISVIHYSWKIFIGFLEKIKIIKLNIKDREKFNCIKNKVIVCTHPSFIDILILISLIPNSTCFAKKELMKNPLMKNIIERAFLSSDMDLEELKIKTKEFLNEGFNVIIFPSGIRHRKNEYPKIKKGAAVIAMNADKNIYAIRMYNDRDFLQIGQPFYDASDDVVNYFITPLGEINISDLKTADEVDTRKNITRAVSDILYSNLE